MIETCYILSGFQSESLDTKRKPIYDEIMLKGISKTISPELLKILAEMGHGDEIVIGDANFPAVNYGKRVVRADGIGGAELLSAVLKLIPLDTYADENLILMEVVKGDDVFPAIWEDYERVSAEIEPNTRIGYMERFAFYERAKNAFAVVASGEEQIYANIILKKGVIR